MIDQNDDVIKNSKILQNMGVDREIANSEETEIALLEQDLGIGDDSVDPEDNPKENIKPQEEEGLFESAVENTFKGFATIGSGVLKGAQELGNFAIDVVDWTDNVFGSGDLLTEDQRIKILSDPKHVYQPESTVGKVSREITSFLMPFGALSKATKGVQLGARFAKAARGAGAAQSVAKSLSTVGKLTQASATGFAVDFMAFDPNEERLSNFVQSVPELQNPITEFLATNPKDTRAEGRFKNALEGLLLGMGVDGAIEAASGLFKATKAYRARRVMQSKMEEGQKVVSKSNAKPDIGEEDLVKEVKAEREVPEFDEAVNDQLVVSKEDFSTALDNADLPDTIRTRINDGELDFDKDLIPQIKEKVGFDFDKLKRGVLPDAEVEKLAKILDVDRDELLNLPPGAIKNAEESVANDLLLDVELAKWQPLIDSVSSGKATPQEKALFHLQEANVRALSNRAGAIRSEQGRALRMARAELRGDKAKVNRQIQDLITKNGGEAGSESLAARIKEIQKAGGDSKQLLKRGRGRIFKDAVFEMWINNILSGPKTHLLNLMSNASVAAMAVPERAISEQFAKRFGDINVGSVAEGEAKALMSGMMASVSDIGRILKRSAIESANNLKKTVTEGTPLPRLNAAGSKIDEASSSINAETLDKISPFSLFNEEGQLNAFGRTVEVASYAMTSPSRALMTSDEMFKAMNFSMEKHAQAVRSARLRGAAEEWSEDQIQKEIKHLIDNPSDEIITKSVEASKINTFTKELGPDSMAKKIEKLIKSEIKIGKGTFQPLRIFFPFVRTPMNIVEFQMDRLPGYFKTKKALKAGGAERDLALARMSVGASFMSATSMLAYNGFITGKGPADPDLQREMKATGWRPNALRLPMDDGDDLYIPYDKLDPFGALIGMAADTTTILTEVADAFIDPEGEDPDNQLKGQEIISSAIGTAAEFATPEFMLENLDGLIGMISNTRESGTRIRNFMANLGTGLLPLSSLMRTTETLISPEQSLTRVSQNETGAFEEIYNRMISQIPGLSDKLPPRRNMFGEPIKTIGAISPLTIVSKKKDPVVDTMIELGMDSIFQGAEPPEGQSFLRVKMPEKVIRKFGVSKRLTAEEYDQFVQLSAGIGLEGVDRTLKEALNDEITSGFPEAQIFAGGGEPTDEAKRRSLKNIISRYRKIARLQLISEGRGIQEGLIESQAKEQEALSGDSFPSIR